MTHNKIKTSEKERLGKKKESYVVMHVFSNNKQDFFSLNAYRFPTLELGADWLTQKMSSVLPTLLLRHHVYFEFVLVFFFYYSGQYHVLIFFSSIASQEISRNHLQTKKKMFCALLPSPHRSYKYILLVIQLI